MFSAKIIKNLKFNEKISSHTTLKTGGNATWYEPKTKDDLLKVIIWANKNKRKIIVLGNGSNVIIKDKPLEYIFIKLSGKDFKNIAFYNDMLEVGAGCYLDKVIYKSYAMGLSGLEYFSMIPGTIGGSIVTNASVCYNDKIIKFNDLIEYIEVVDKFTGNFSRINFDKEKFNKSNFLYDKVIVSAKLKLKSDKKNNIKKKINFSRKYRENTQDYSYPSCGCIFSNFQGKSAGALIELSGLKGQRLGKAYVSSKHANFIINKGKQNSKDILGLIDLIQKKVFEKFEIMLEKEIEIIE